MVVFPPSLASTWERVGIGSAPIKELPYPSSVFPGVFIFDDTGNPQRVLGWITRAAMNGPSTRIRLLSLQNRIVATDGRLPVGRELPWFAPLEIYNSFERENGDAAAAAAYRTNNSHLFEDTFGGLSPSPGLYAWVATIVPSKRSASIKQRNLPAPYARVAEAIGRREHVQIPLLITQDANGVRASWPANPHDFTFQPVPNEVRVLRGGRSDRFRLYLSDLARLATPEPLGALKFVRSGIGSEDWLTETGDLQLLMGYTRLTLFQTAVTGNWMSWTPTDYAIVR